MTSREKIILTKDQARPIPQEWIEMANDVILLRSTKRILAEVKRRGLQL